MFCKPLAMQVYNTIIWVPPPQKKKEERKERKKERKLACEALKVSERDEIKKNFNK